VNVFGYQKVVYPLRISEYVEERETHVNLLYYFPKVRHNTTAGLRMRVDYYPTKQLSIMGSDISVSGV